MKDGQLRNRKGVMDHPRHSQPPERWFLVSNRLQSRVVRIEFSCHFSAQLRFIQEGIERRLGLQNVQ